MKVSKEIKIIFSFVTILFIVFLILPIGTLLLKSIIDQGQISWQHFQEVLGAGDFRVAFQNSFIASGLTALITTLLAFMIAYTINYTNVLKPIKITLQSLTMLPMLLPTMTYGFAIIYSFGKQGLWTKLFGHQLFEIYGLNGLVLGYVIYTLPIAFMLIHNAMGYIDKKFMIVSQLMEDRPYRTFFITLFRPLMGTLAAAFIQSFFLSFTDFGIPAAVGGQYEVVASVLYNQMLGSVPNFANGAVVALMMLLPSIISITLLHYLERFNMTYNKISIIDFKKNYLRDSLFGFLSGVINGLILGIFAVIFLIPFIKAWPYQIVFTLDNIVLVLQDGTLLSVIKNSLFVAIGTALFGTLIVYGSALINARSVLKPAYKKFVEIIALLINTIPGMVLGIAYLLLFSGTSLQNTFFIIIVCNIIHFFSSPYLMMKNSLMKMNKGYEVTAQLMGDSWLQTIIRVITPNALSSLLEVFSYYFINAMVTVSAVIFIAGARTMVMTTKIKELQHFAKFNEIFVLSILILLINLIAKGFIFQLTKRRKRL